ncbi:MAG TPA: hypothetical protein VKZ55_10430 [Microthrixaceae bacterium]|nr:hypothetical protein [Microthrixaceae bacterium]
MDLTQTRVRYDDADYRWLGSQHGTEATRSVTIDVTELNASTHYPNGYLPSGTPLGVLNGSDLYGVYDGTDPDTLTGFLLEPIKINPDSDTAAGALLEHGRVIEAFLPFEIDADGIADVAGRIIVIEADGGGS